MSTYKGWPLLEELPQSWKFDKTVGSPLCGYEFVTNGKSLLNGQKRALLRVVPAQKQLPFLEPGSPKIEHVAGCADECNVTRKPVHKFCFDTGSARVVNELARQRFKHKLLADILVDLMICEIEGWAKAEYLKELRTLINSIGRNELIDG